MAKSEDAVVVVALANFRRVAADATSCGRADVGARQESTRHEGIGGGGGGGGDGGGARRRRRRADARGLDGVEDARGRQKVGAASSTVVRCSPGCTRADRTDELAPPDAERLVVAAGEVLERHRRGLSLLAAARRQCGSPSVRVACIEKAFHSVRCASRALRKSAQVPRSALSTPYRSSLAHTAIVPPRSAGGGERQHRRAARGGEGAGAAYRSPPRRRRRGRQKREKPWPSAASRPGKRSPNKPSPA